LLIVTAILKSHALFVDPLKSEMLGVSASIQLMAVELEVLLALWLLSGFQVKKGLIASCVFFASVACVAGKQVYEQQSSCACFGVFEVHPIVMLLLDIVLLTVLVLVVVSTKWTEATGQERLGNEFVRTLKYTGGLSCSSPWLWSLASLTDCWPLQGISLSS
jgi:hypothetical protein